MEESDPALEILEWAELAATPGPGKVRSALERAFGYSGLGIVCVRGVPGLISARSELLPRVRAFALSPPAVRSSCERPQYFHSSGWSCGVEKLAGGKPDVYKGSYYFTATEDEPSTDAAEISAFPTFAAPNVWPRPTDAPGFENAAKVAARLAINAGAALASHCDALVAEALPGDAGVAYAAGASALARIVREARFHKGRALFYYAAMPDVKEVCSWHNDHCSLTALLPAQFFAADGSELSGCPDSVGGLFIRTRRGATVRVSVPHDCLAFQIGEAAQIASGGVLQATPHCVRAPAAPGVERATLAVFMEPNYDLCMAPPAGADDAAVLRAARGELLPPGVPPLISRWTGPSQTFGEFTVSTFAAYH